MPNRVLPRSTVRLPDGNLVNTREGIDLLRDRKVLFIEADMTPLVISMMTKTGYGSFNYTVTHLSDRTVRIERT